MKGQDGLAEKVIFKISAGGEGFLGDVSGEELWKLSLTSAEEWA